MQGTFNNPLSAKQMANWGKVYDITKNNATNTTIPATNVNVQPYLQVYINNIIQDAQANINADGIYTLVFPVRDYIIETRTNLDHIHLDLRTLSPSITNVQFNIIGLDVSYSTGALDAMLQQ
jgi:hypothetical protein